MLITQINFTNLKLNIYDYINIQKYKYNYN